jgi:hypothetical protein
VSWQDGAFVHHEPGNQNECSLVGARVRDGEVLGGFENILVGDDVDIQCSGSPLLQPDSPVQVFDSGDFFEYLLGT